MYMLYIHIYAYECYKWQKKMSVAEYKPHINSFWTFVALDVTETISTVDILCHKKPNWLKYSW